MVRSLFSRRSSSSPDGARPTSARSAVESIPPPEFARSWPSRIGDWLAASGWRVAAIDASAFGCRAGREAVAAARLDFAEALFDIRTDGAADALDRIAETRELHELWHLRAEVFGRVAERRGQGEAERRLAALDRHFPHRARRARSRR